MFSQNDKISVRQLFRLLVLDLFGMTSLVLPAYLAKTSGIDGLWALLIGMLFGLLYLNIINSLVKKMKGEYLDYIKNQCGSFAASVIGAVYLVLFVLLGIYVLYTDSRLMHTTLLTDVPMEIIGLILILLSAYGSKAGIEGRARIYEILFPVLFFFFFLMMVFAAGAVDTDYWTPVFFADVADVLGASYVVFSFFSIVSIVLFSVVHLKKKEDVKRSGRGALIFTTVVLMVSFLILAGNFLVKGVSLQQWPIITLMTMIPIPGQFLQRQDVFMVGVWFFCLFALLSSAVFYGKSILGQLLGKEAAKWPLWTILGCIYAGVIVLERVWFDAEFLERVFLYVGVPFVVLIPILLLVLSKKEKPQCKKEEAV